MTNAATLRTIRTKLQTVKRFQSELANHDHSISLLLDAVSELTDLVETISDEFSSLDFRVDSLRESVN